MMKKICPVCDHVMKWNHYCHFCKRWVGQPNLVNATYYLNERHPEHETDCEYHNPSFLNDRRTVSPAPWRAGGGRKGQAAAAARTAGQRAAQAGKQLSSYGDRMARAGSSAKGEQKKSPLRSLVIVICVIFGLNILLSLAAPILMMLFRFF